LTTINYDRVFTRRNLSCGSKILKCATKHGRRVRILYDLKLMFAESFLELITAILAKPKEQHPSKDDIARVLEQVSLFSAER
jgi:hypothetical protein